MIAKPDGKGWRENDGTAEFPKGVRRKKVDVVLRNGMARSGWPGDGGRPPTRWSLIGSPFDIVWFRVSQ